MPEPLKNMYNESFFEGFITIFKNVYPNLNIEKFRADILDNTWEDLELKQRMQHIAVVMYKHLPSDYGKATSIIIDMVKQLKVSEESMSFEYMFFPEFIEQFGLDNYEISINAIEEITKFTSCEFTVRPFLIKYPKRMIPQMLEWSKHDNAMVRRLASEGSRPRLPWGMGLPAFKKDPDPVIPILENLKSDPSESVRRSVANNLNDISKDHPELVLKLVKKWSKEFKTAEMKWLVKHACRTLLKQGHKDTLNFFGFKLPKQVAVNKLEVLTPKVKMGDELRFQFEVSNKSTSNIMLRLEYGIYFKKANGSLSRKVFKISEKKFPENSKLNIVRRQSFKPITTRKHYTGIHEVSIILNGVELKKAEFELET